MYMEKLKKEIASNLIRFDEITRKQTEIETDTALSEDVLLNADSEDEDYGGLEGLIEEWQILAKEKSGIYYALVRAFTRSVHYPIFSLSGEKVCTLFSDLSSIFRQDEKCSVGAIDDLLEEIDLTERKDRIKRSHLVEPLFLVCSDQIWLERMYRQAIACFINGAFWASCVLCRAICEIALKKYLKRKIPSGGFEGRNFSELLNDFCEKFKLLKPATIGRSRDINFAANELMHQGKGIDEKTAFKSIQSMQILLQEIFKCET